MSTLIATHPMNDGGIMEVHDDGTVARGTTEWKVKRYFYKDSEGNYIRDETILVGKRGAEYLLRGYLNDDTGKRAMISLTSGAEYRSKGNRVEVIEIAGIIEFLN